MATPALRAMNRPTRICLAYGENHLLEICFVRMVLDFPWKQHLCTEPFKKEKGAEHRANDLKMDHIQY